MRRRVLVLAVGLALLVAACSSASGDSTSATTAPKGPVSGAVTIRPSGFAPEWTIVQVGGTVMFRNDTTASRQIVFDNARDAYGAPVQSPPIAAGKSWRWTADSFASFAYHSPGISGAGGRIQVEPPAEPD
jgi:plastocyanin